MFSLKASWPPSLQVTAILGWAFQQCQPLDYLRWLEFFAEICWPVAGQAVDPEILVWLFAANALKWPPVIAVFANARQGEAPKSTEEGQGEAPKSTEEKILSAIMSCLAWADGRPLARMHARMSSGRMHSTTGLAVVARELGLTTNTEPDGGRAAREFRLGPRGKSYWGCPEETNPRDALAIIRGWLDAARKHPVVWPTSVTFTAFAGSVAQAAHAMRAVQSGGAGLSGRAANSYRVLGFVRAMLLAAGEGPCAPCWRSIRMSQVLEWTPDENNHCDAIQGMLCEDVLRVFGMSPLWVSCWACYSSQCTPDDIHLIRGTAEAEFQDIADEWRSVADDGEDDKFPPMPMTFVKHARGEPE